MDAIRIEHDSKGFRRATCLFCGKMVRVVSFGDDTRWRYDRHPDGGLDDENCDNTFELIPISDALRPGTEEE